MYSYPVLTETQQQNLPALIKPAVSIPQAFEDSTHRLWFCETEQGEMVLKVCDHQSVKKSSFWQAMNSLFAADFPASLESINYTHQYLQQNGHLLVPEHIVSEKSSFVLTRFLAGQDIEQHAVTDDLVIKLAKHLAVLHQQTSTTWGRLSKPTLKADEWSTRLHDVLVALVETNEINIPQDIVELVLEQTKMLQVEQFVPIMPDLRWDQLRLLENGELAVVDLDAFVIAPRELELVLLEYLLIPQQAELFKQVYQAYLPIPDLSDCRYSYRLLLFLMNVLGESSIENWMTSDICF
jgi:hypothetical protein